MLSGRNAEHCVEWADRWRRRWSCVGGVQRGAFVGTCVCTATRTHADNKIGSEGGAALGKALEKNSTLQTLDVSGM